MALWYGCVDACIRGPHIFKKSRSQCVILLCIYKCSLKVFGHITWYQDRVFGIGISVEALLLF